MPLRAIVRALGGDLYDGGRRANVPAPGHSPRDRSVSLLWTGARLVVHGFGAAGWREVLDDLRARGLIDAAGAPPDAGVVVITFARSRQRTFAVLNTVLDAPPERATNRKTHKILFLLVKLVGAAGLEPATR